MKQLLLPVLVRKSNLLARANWDPQSVLEPRLVALVASQIQKDDLDFKTYKIPLQALMGDSDYRGGAKYRRLHALAMTLCSTAIPVPRATGSDVGRKGFRVISMFSECELDGAAFLVRFHPDMKPHFLALKDGFTEYNLLEFMQLASTYSQRLFEILKSWDDVPEVTFSIEELHQMLAVPPSLKKDFKALRIRVLEPAFAEITDKTSFRYEWSPVRLQVSKKDEKPIKWGRKIVAVRFVFSKARVAEAEHKKKKEDLSALESNKKAKNLRTV
jgi:plasmid replication initiation protein